jgi:hypothetical protein
VQCSGASCQIACTGSGACTGGQSCFASTCS